MNFEQLKLKTRQEILQVKLNSLGSEFKNIIKQKEALKQWEDRVKKDTESINLEFWDNSCLLDSIENEILIKNNL